MSTWQKTTLGEVAAGFLGGGTPTTKQPEYWQGDIPWITSKWLGNQLELSDGEKFISREAVKRTSTNIVPKDSIIFATRVGVGKVGINRLNLAINQDLAGVLIDDGKFDIKFFAYQLGIGSIQQYLAMNKRGATIKGITRGCLKEIRLNLPPLPEQKKIAHILSMVQRAIKAQERIIQTTTELKKALMHKLFTEGLRNESQKKTEIGLIPECWKIVKLETTGDVVYGIQAAVASNLAPVGTPILTNKNITLDGGLDLEKLNYFKLTSKRHLATILQKGDILFNWRSGSKFHVGKTAYFDLDGEWVHSSFILRIRPDQKINGRYLFYYFNHLRIAEFFVKLQTYAVNAKFNKSAVNALPTAVPGRDEQDEIANILDSAQRKIDFVKQKHRVLQDFFRTLLQELMTGEIRV